MSGEVTTGPISCGSKTKNQGAVNKSSFVMKLDEIIAGFPEEIVVMYYSGNGFHLRQGDRVKVHGSIYQEMVKFWNDDFIWISAEHIFNETLKCGF